MHQCRVDLGGCTLLKSDLGSGRCVDVSCYFLTQDGTVSMSELVAGLLSFRGELQKVGPVRVDPCTVWNLRKQKWV